MRFLDAGSLEDARSLEVARSLEDARSLEEGCAFAGGCADGAGITGSQVWGRAVGCAAAPPSGETQNSTPLGPPAGAVSVQPLSRVQLFATPRTAARQASLSITNSRSLPKLMSIESVMPSNHLVLCRPLLQTSIFPSIRVFTHE